MTASSRGSNVTFWILQILLAVVYLYFGAAKLAPHNEFWIRLFAKIGVGQWFRYFTGGLEVGCAVLLLIPRTSAIAAVLLAGTMVGAILVRLFVLKSPAGVIVVPAVLLVALLAVIWKRRATLLVLRGS